MSRLTNRTFTSSGTFVVPSGIATVISYGRGHSTADSDLLAFPFDVTPGLTYTITVTTSGSLITHMVDSSTITDITFANGSGTLAAGEIIIQWID